MSGIRYEPTMVSIDTVSLVVATVKDLIDLQPAELDEGAIIYLDAKSGVDGSGSHPYRHQLPEAESNDGPTRISDANFVGAFFTPLSIKVIKL